MIAGVVGIRGSGEGRSGNEGVCEGGVLVRRRGVGERR